MILAVTGATGFVGSHLLDLALAEGHSVRALTRRPQPCRTGVTWVAGDLADVGALAEGADAIVHLAGLVSAPDLAGFRAANVEGTRTLLAAARAAEVPRFVHVSSLAAREPGLSDYGRSKAESEGLVRVSDRRWTIVRPPAIFGPRDTEMRELFRLADRRILPLPPRGARFSVLYVADLARLLLDLATGDALIGATVEPDDGERHGWDYREFGRALGRAVGRQPLLVSLPAALVAAAARADRLVRGANAKLTTDRVRYMVHPDWTAHDLPPADVWTAATPTSQALADTAAWYRANGLL